MIIYFSQLDISGCLNVTDEGLMALAQLPHLTSLNISYLCNVSTGTMQDMTSIEFCTCFTQLV